MLEFILLTVFILLLIHYLVFLSIIYKGLSKLNTADSSYQIKDEFVSVIIPFRNESENILESLKSIESQNYPEDKFEVIYVNDASTDDSVEILEKNKSKKNIKIISVPYLYSINAHKKRAIRYGIENSVGEIIVTTDADCFHNSEWLISMLQNFDEETAFVSGPVEIIEGDNFFSKFEEIEFTGLILTGAGLIGAGKPTICNGANIAYRKKVFKEVGGFKDHLKLSSGDDELLMQKIAAETKYKIKFSLNQKSIVRTLNSKNIRDFYQQRKRWASKGLFYNDKSLILKLVLIYFYYIGLFIQLFLFYCLSCSFLVTLSVSILCKIIFEFRILKKGKELLFPRLSIQSIIFAEFFQTIYLVVVGYTGMFGNFLWKERKIKR
ncbi:MAG: glycosyltransferase [Ignavibacteriaceae bacterium]